MRSSARDSTRAAAQSAAPQAVENVERKRRFRCKRSSKTREDCGRYAGGVHDGDRRSLRIFAFRQLGNFRLYCRPAMAAGRTAIWPGRACRHMRFPLAASARGRHVRGLSNRQTAPAGRQVQRHNAEQRAERGAMAWHIRSTQGMRDRFALAAAKVSRPRAFARNPVRI